MDFSELSDLVLVLAVKLHEFLITDSLDFVRYLLNFVFKTFKTMLACLLAFSTGLVLLGVYLGTLALEADDVLSKAFARSRALFAGLSILLDFGSLAFLTLGNLIHALFPLGFFWSGNLGIQFLRGSKLLFLLSN